MCSKADPEPQDVLGDFDALICELNTPSDAVVVSGGYAELMARIASADYRRRCAS